MHTSKDLYFKVRKISSRISRLKILITFLLSLHNNSQAAKPTSTNNFLVFFKIRYHIYCGIYIFLNYLTWDCAIIFIRFLSFFNVTNKAFRYRSFDPFSINPVVFIVQFCIVRWVLGLHALSYSNTDCTVMKYINVLGCYYLDLFIPTQPWFGHYRLQVWTPKLNLSLLSGPRTRASQDLLHSLRSSGLNQTSWKPYTAQHPLEGLPRNPIHPSAVCYFISDSINLILSLWSYLPEALYICAVPIVCFLLNKHLFALSTVKQCWLSRQGWMEAGVPSWVTKEAALESQHCAYGTQTHIFRSLGCGLSILQTFHGLFGKAWLFCKTRQTSPCKKQLGPALQEVRRTGWKSDPWPPSKPHFNHCHLWNAFPGEFYYSFLTT